MVVNHITYKIKSNKIIEAVSACFKCMFSLNLDFPNECKHIWTFRQRHIYKVELNNLKPYASVNKLIAEINTLKEKEDLANLAN